MVVDFCPPSCRTYNPLFIDGTPVQRVSSFKYLGVLISEGLSWTVHTDTVVRQHLYHLRQFPSWYERLAVSRSPNGS